jgi:hypothetical protein
LYSYLVSTLFGYSGVHWQGKIDSLQRVLLNFTSISLSGLIFYLIYKFKLVLTVVLSRIFSKVDIYVILGLAFFLRLVWVLTSGSTLVSDFIWYNNSAIDILHGESILSYISNTRNIGTSIFIAIHYLVFGINYIFPLITIAILSTLQILFVYLIVSKIVNKKAALFSALLLAIFPEHIFLTNLLGSDVLFAFLICAGIYVIMESLSVKGLKRYLYLLSAGLIFGMSHWTRATAPVFVFSAFVFIIFDNRVRLKSRILYAGAFISGFFIIILPIIIYNFDNAGGLDIKPIHGQQGKSLLIGTFYNGEGRCEKWQLNEDHDLLKHKVTTYMADKYGDTINMESIPAHEYGLVLDKVYTKLAIQRVIESPKKFITLVARDKVKNLWGIVAGLGFSIDNSMFSNIKGSIWAFSEIWHRLILLFCGIVFLVLVYRKVDVWDIRLIFVLSALLTTLSHLILESHPRYHHMFLPLLVMYLGEYFFESRRKT